MGERMVMGFRTASSTHCIRQAATGLALIGAIGWIAGCDREQNRSAATTSQAAAPAAAPGILLAAPLGPDASLAEALKHPDPLERARRVAEILEAAPADQLRDVTNAFEAAALPWGDMEYGLFISWWARFDPSAALSYAQDDQLRTDHPSVTREAMRIWARRDPKAVIQSGWLNSISIDLGGLNPAMVEPFVIGWFESGNPGLEVWIQELDTSTKATAMGTFMRMLVLRDGPLKALEWTQTAAVDPGNQRLFLGAGLNTVARVEPTTAVAFLDVAEKNGVDTRTFVARIGRGWATHDPKAAMEWVISNDIDANERWRTIHDVADAWLYQDEKGLEEWLKPRAKEEWADQIRKQWNFHHVKRNRYHVDWPMLMQHAAEFVNEDARRAEYLWLIQRWRAMEPEAAAAWLAKNEALLGDKLQYADQLWQHDREEIDKILAEDKAAREKADDKAAQGGGSAPSAS
ncbi:MAG: hypothetical protein IPK00_07240 [Deltaproteobacteria bacterium]|nr:hypothetical protein [Deltaproteobacteria bacterium]